MLAACCSAGTRRSLCPVASRVVGHENVAARLCALPSACTDTHTMRIPVDPEPMCGHVKVDSEEAIRDYARAFEERVLGRLGPCRGVTPGIARSALCRRRSGPSPRHPEQGGAFLLIAVDPALRIRSDVRCMRRSAFACFRRRTEGLAVQIQAGRSAGRCATRDVTGRPTPARPRRRPHRRRSRGPPARGDRRVAQGGCPARIAQLLHDPGPPPDAPISSPWGSSPLAHRVLSPGAGTPPTPRN